MTVRIWPIGLAAAGLLLAGCASSRAVTPSSDHTPASTSPMSMPMTTGGAMPGMSMAPGQTMASASSSVDTAKPTATALMICSDDIKGKVRQVVKLAGQPKTTSMFAHQIYTCTYRLPVGPLVLSVQHAATKAAADAYYNNVRATLGPTASLDGLGDKAYGAASGVAVVEKDDETLVVDARGVPAVFGADQQKRTDLANEIASDVLGCWTGD